MHHHWTISQLTLLVGTALTVAAVLILLFYILHKAVRRQRARVDFKAKSPRAENEPAFVAAAVQGVIADLKASQKNLETRLRSAEEQSRISQRTLEILARDIEECLIVINHEGFITRANGPARELLRADLWSKRPYAEILGRDSALCALIQQCVESGRALKQEVKVGLPDRAEAATLEASVAPLQLSGGLVEGVVCLLRKAGRKVDSEEPPSDGVATPSGGESGS